VHVPVRNKKNHSEALCWWDRAGMGTWLPGLRLCRFSMNLSQAGNDIKF